MITLTNPFVAVSSLGGTTGVVYDVLDVINIVFDVPGTTISGGCRLRSSANPEAVFLVGAFTINAGDTPTLTINIPLMSWGFALALNGTQKNNLITGISNAQNQIETAIVNLGVVVGVQSTGI